MSKKPILGWHFLADDKRLGHGDGRVVQLGKWCKVKGDVIECENAMHSGRTLRDALQYAAGSRICRVEMTADARDKTHDKGILFARGRRVLWWIDGERLLHEFACCCAEDALALIDKPDPRSVEAVKVKRQWLRGEATDAKLAAAWVAARDAAWDAAGAAASAAARDAAWDAAGVAARAAAGAAASAAAKDAAGDAAGVAARAAARAAASAAAKDAALDAAWDAEKRWQTARLFEYLSGRRS